MGLLLRKLSGLGKPRQAQGRRNALTLSDSRYVSSKEPVPRSEAGSHGSTCDYFRKSALRQFGAPFSNSGASATGC
jgi:hypothetical protein